MSEDKGHCPDPWVDRMMASYVECALWSSVDDEGRSLDEHEGELTPGAVASMLGDVGEFADYQWELIERSGLSAEQVGHDFWLTRNGHGTGFWDRGLGEVGDALTKAAKVFGGCDLVVTDDGSIDCLG